MSDPITQSVTSNATALPLAGVRVMDWTRLLPGPWCSQMLADLGAEVIKVERRGVGDPSRHNAPNYREGSVYFHSVNGGKKSLTIDFNAPGARELTKRLIQNADVVIESFGASVAARHGLDGATALDINPKLIHCSISGYGQTGPLAGVPGHDLVVQAATGLLAPGGTMPRMPSVQVADYSGAMMACIGILAALRRRDQYGVGAALEISMFDSMLQLGQIGFASAMARAAGASGEPAMEVWGGNPRYAIYPTRDDRAVAVSLLEERSWRKFCAVIGRPELAAEREDPSLRLSSHGAQTKVYRDAIAAYCAARDADAIEREMSEQNIAIVPVLTPDEALASRHTKHRELFESVPHPAEGRISVLNNPLHRSGLARKERSPAPEMGADSAAILFSLGLSRAEVAELVASEVV